MQLPFLRLIGKGCFLQQLEVTNTERINQLLKEKFDLSRQKVLYRFLCFMISIDMTVKEKEIDSRALFT